MHQLPNYWQLLGLIVPVFIILACGVGLRRVGWLTEAAETSFTKVLLCFFYPAMILRAVLGNAALREPANVLWPPFIGFSTMVLGFAMGHYVGKALGLTKGQGLRTFAFAAGIYNYGFIPIPLMESLFGHEGVGVLLVHNVGCELAIWTVGLIVLSGASWREGWRKIFNPAAITLVVGLLLNFSGIVLPGALQSALNAVAGCAIPLGLLLTGATLAPHLRAPWTLVTSRDTWIACGLRLAVMPMIFLAAAYWLPVPLEVQRIMVIEAAMPAGMIPLLVARHYGGQTEVAARIIVGTTVLGLLVIPWWLRFGMMWLGL